MTADSGQDIADAKIYVSLGHYLLDRGHDWRRPSDQGPGDWMPAFEGELEPWENSYPLCRGARQLLKKLGPEIYQAEVDGEVIEGEDLIHARRVRLLAKTAWDERAARLFAIDCAERVLPIYEKVNPQDDRPRRGLAAARAFVDGEIDREALETAIEAVGAAQTDARIAEDDITWGSSVEEGRLHEEAGYPIWAAHGAVKAAGNALAWGERRREYKRRSTAASSAGRAASWAAGALIHNFAARKSEEEWQARRLLEYL